MPVIPTIQSQLSPVSELPNTRATPSDFGAGIGAAMQDVAEGIGSLADAADTFALKQRKEKLANAQANSDYTGQYLELQNGYDPKSGKNFADIVGPDYDKWATDQVNAHPELSGDARAALRAELQSRRNQYTSNASKYQFEQATVVAKNDAATAIDTVTNRVRLDNTQYNTALADGNAVIDSRSDIPESFKPLMRTKLASDLAEARFSSLIMGAKTPADIDAIMSQLNNGTELDDGKGGKSKVNWTTQLDQNALERTLTGLASAKEHIGTKLDTDTRASIESLEKRLEDATVKVSPDELTSIGQAVAQSGNVALMNRYAALSKRYDINKQYAGLPSSYLQSVRDQAAGGTGAFPNSPPEVAAAAQLAQEVSGGTVNAATALSVMHLEYGGNFNRTKGNVNLDYRYAPRPVGNTTPANIEALRPAVKDGLVLAGTIFGKPLDLKSATRSQTRQDEIYATSAPGTAAKSGEHVAGNAVDIDTSKMNEAEKARMIDALIQSGFSTFGEYAGHIHADMREVVGNWQAAIGQDFSPEVKAVLERRGAVKGANAADIDRAGPGGMVRNVGGSWQVDYGRSTDITDASGRPTSSAVGVGQFVKGTWLGLLDQSNTRNAAAIAKVSELIGADVTKLSDDQKLELRKRPDVSGVMIGAELAANKLALEGALNRPVDDTELYMSHVLGAAGATAVLSARQRNADQSAADLLPEAADKNHALFYNKNGSAKTVGQLYNDMAENFGTAPSRIGFVGVQALDDLRKAQDKALKDDPLKWASDTGRFTVTALSQDDPNSWNTRGIQAMSVANYYSIPQNDMKVFTADEAQQLGKLISDGTADQKVALIKQIGAMPDKAQQAAFKQLGQTDPSFEFAAGVAKNVSPGVASDILRGQERIKNDPTLSENLGMRDYEIKQAFGSYMGNAIFDSNGRTSGQVYNAAVAHYVSTYQTSAGNGVQKFNLDAFKKSVDTVLGGRVDDVNGFPTVLPAGVSGSDFEAAVASMQPSDLIANSVDGKPPIARDGYAFTPFDLSAHGRFQSVGAGQYLVAMPPDYAYVASGFDEETGAVTSRYVMKLDASTISRLKATRRPDLSLSDPYFTMMNGGAQ